MEVAAAAAALIIIHSAASPAAAFNLFAPFDLRLSIGRLGPVIVAAGKTAAGRAPNKQVVGVRTS